MTSRISAALVLMVSFAAVCCSHGSKLSRIRDNGLSAVLQLPADATVPSTIPVDTPARDTLTVTDMDGHKVLIMKAVRDDESGEMVATEQLNAAVVTSRFRNVAERHGRVDIQFQIRIPYQMHDSRWQLRFHPMMFMLGDTLSLDDVIVTGADYRAAQLRGYQQYERFLSRIVSDTTRFVSMHLLEVFIQRNLPEVYAFKSDSTVVSDEEFYSHYGVTQQQAIEHYTNWIAVNANSRRRSRVGRMWAKYVKAPIETDHIRLDTVIRTLDGDFIYDYVQTVKTRPGLRKLEIVLGGEILEQGRRVYHIPSSEPLAFYISSLSTLVDQRERYLTKVIERRVEANTFCRIDFKSGKSDIDPQFSSNASELRRIRQNLDGLLVSDVFELDSITISASASPEGSFRMNDRLSAARAASVAVFFRSYVKSIQDSLDREIGIRLSLDGQDSHLQPEHAVQDIQVASRSAGENWRFLDAIVDADTLMTDNQKSRYFELAEMKDPDRRECAMKTEPWYPRMRRDIYPRLRTVQFNFVMHRRGMQKDTVHTTELDTVYMSGVKALLDRDYEKAAMILGPYGGYNAAVAYVSLDRNASAMAILQSCPESAPVDYMMAVLHARGGDDEMAVQCYLHSCQQDHSFVHRGNLDPEIAALIRRYSLRNREEDETLL